MRHLRRFGGRLLITLGLGTLIASGALGTATLARAQESPAVAQITSPGDGAQLFGPVNITGSALHPSAFDRYTLEYDLLSDVGADWLLVQEPVTQQVQDGVLGTWDTAAVPDGVYQLRLRVYLDNGEVAEVIVSNLRVQNRQPTPVPTIAPAGAAPPTPGPTPTSPIVQPPTLNQQPALETEPLVAEPGDGEPAASLLQADSGSTRVNFDRVRQAFCTGGIIALGIFLVIALYHGLRRLTRGGPRSPLAGDDY